MCGRFVSSNTPERIAEYFGATLSTDLSSRPPDQRLDQNYNVAPTTDICAVVAPAGSTRVADLFRWGLVPSWAKDTKIGAKMINARAETVADKPVFRKLLASKRLLVPMDGYYEWQVIPGRKSKQPMFIHRRDGEPLAAAGLWAAWRDPTGDRDTDPDAGWLHSCTIITTTANDVTSAAHDRMPVFLPATKWDAWLDPSNRDVTTLTAMLGPAPNELLEMHPVSTAVNNVRNNGAELIQPVERDAASLVSPSLL